MKAALAVSSAMLCSPGLAFCAHKTFPQLPRTLRAHPYSCSKRSTCQAVVNQPGLQMEGAEGASHLQPAALDRSAAPPQQLLLPRAPQRRPGTPRPWNSAGARCLRSPAATPPRVPGARHRRAPLQRRSRLGAQLRRWQLGDALRGRPQYCGPSRLRLRRCIPPRQRRGPGARSPFQRPANKIESSSHTYLLCSCSKHVIQARRHL